MFMSSVQFSTVQSGPCFVAQTKFIFVLTTFFPPKLVKFCTWYVHSMLPKIYEFLENRRRENRTFLMGKWN